MLRDNIMKIKLIIVLLVLSFICLSKPCYAVTKCYKDICVGQTVIVSKGLYKNNLVNILAILKEKTPYEDAQQVRDYYKYYVSFMDGTIAYLYRDELKIRK